MTLTLLTAIIGSVKSGIELLEERERNYPQRQAEALKQRVEDLEKAFLKEYNRGEENMSDAVLDHLYLELRILLGDFTSVVRVPKVSHK